MEFTLSGETDGGLSFGASFRADNAAGANAGTAGSVFISGGFGTLSMGDVDGAANAALGHVDGVGLTGLGDLNEVTYLCPTVAATSMVMATSLRATKPWIRRPCIPTRPVI
ncbi:MAG: porin [Rhodobacteraceae bacterium]|nr:porin [Paracoccaceae bacterium]